jgi:hypothetical protein
VSIKDGVAIFRSAQRSVMENSYGRSAVIDVGCEFRGNAEVRNVIAGIVPATALVVVLRLPTAPAASISGVASGPTAEAIVAATESPLGSG